MIKTILSFYILTFHAAILTVLVLCVVEKTTYRHPSLPTVCDYPMVNIELIMPARQIVCFVEPQLNWLLKEVK